MDQFQMESYVQGLQGHCRVCGLVSPATRNSSSPRNLNGDLCNEIKVSGKYPVEGPGEESFDNEELSHKEFLQELKVKEQLYVTYLLSDVWKKCSTNSTGSTNRFI